MKKKFLSFLSVFVYSYNVYVDINVTFRKNLQQLINSIPNALSIFFKFYFTLMLQCLFQILNYFLI